MNPFKRVPTLEIDGMFIVESVAALQYLGDRKDVADHWYPKDLKDRALVNTYLAWHPADMRKHAHGYVQALFGGGSIDESTAKSNYEAMLDNLETIWLKANPFLAGSKLTIADLHCVCELSQLEAYGKGYLTEQRPKLAVWMEKVKANLQPHFNEVHTSFMAEAGERYQEYKSAKL
ncbi:unnamed protein product [Owenia fusiformis]|nr:unnamed protein product [Owenia fusiformis]